MKIKFSLCNKIFISIAFLTLAISSAQSMDLNKINLAKKEQLNPALCVACPKCCFSNPPIIYPPNLPHRPPYYH